MRLPLGKPLTALNISISKHHNYTLLFNILLEMFSKNKQRLIIYKFELLLKDVSTNRELIEGNIKNEIKKLEEEGKQVKFNIPSNGPISDLRIIWYLIAFQDKLKGLQYTYAICKDDTIKLNNSSRTETKEDKVILNKTYDLRTLASIYFECFLYFAIGMFDILASITYYMYPEHQKAINKQYFKYQIDNFIKVNINQDYASLLKKNKQWLDDLNQIRDALTHKASVFIGFNEGRIQIIKRKPYDDYYLPKSSERFDESRKKFIDFLVFIDDNYKNIYDFLESFTNIHRKLIPESENNEHRLKFLK